MSVYKKWSPIMDAIIPHKSDKVKNVCCEYAEHHSMLDSGEYSLGDGNLLPISLKVLSDVDLDNIMEKNNFILSKTPLESFVFRIKISYDNWDELKIMGIDYIQHCESVLRTNLSGTLNKLTKGATAIKVYKLVDSITLDKETREMVLISNFKVTGSREQKLKRILK